MRRPVSMKKVTVEELLAKADQPSKDAMRLHPSIPKASSARTAKTGAGCNPTTRRNGISA
jgi:hypothetical protein